MRSLATLFVYLVTIVTISMTSTDVGAQPQVYRDRVEPNWFDNHSKFWYRIDSARDHHEFILVDAVAGTRNPAFDHAEAAKKLSAILGKEVSPKQLPFSSLEYSDDGEKKGAILLLSGSEGKFRLDQTTGEFQRIEPAVGAESAALFLPTQPSGSSARDSEIVVQNSLDQPIRLLWVNTSGGLQEYGQIAPGETHRQHTFESHVWLFRGEDGKDLGCFRAVAESVHLRIDQTAVDNVVRDEPNPRRGRRNRNGNGGGRDAQGESSSPDGAVVAFCKDNNLWLRQVSDGEETAITSDATPDNSFRRDAVYARAVGMSYNQKDFPESAVEVQWSSDSAFLLAFQTTRVEERKVHYIESTPGDQLQPKLRSYPYLKPGDPIPQSTPRLFRISDRTEIPVSTDLCANPWSLEFLRWSDDNSRFWLLYNERGHQRLRILEVKAADGKVRAVVDEFSPTFIHYSSEGKFELRWLPGDQLLWASERSGWNHLYRYDINSGQVLNAVTSGNWNVRRIEHIDEASGVIWFFAVGIRDQQDPYHEHFCRVNFDGTGLTVLTEGDGTHEVTWSPDRRWFLARFSRVDQPPITELRSAEGHLLCELETSDASEVIAARGALPMRFTAKGRDGETDIWGIVHLPRNFDSTRSFPVIENIYAGPHDHHVPKAFQIQYGHRQLTDVGFVVVQIDGMGTAWRSKAFHDVCYRNLKDAGFPDRIAWMKALGQKLPQLDLERVGIYGGSAGGQNAMAALLWHGDFYKSAVADCGCHDNRMDKIWWNEQWMGVPEENHYAENSNMENAGLLRGDLMLVVGELDRNVDPATSTQVAKRLVDAGKDFEFVVVPGAGHGACETPWASRKRTAFFVRTLKP